MVLLSALLFVAQKMRPLGMCVIDYYCKNLCKNHNHAKPEIIFTTLAGKEANIDYLDSDDVEYWERDDFFPDDSSTSEFTVVYEAQVVFVHIVFEHEEAHSKHWDIRYQSWEHKCDSKRRQPIRHVIAEIICICIHKLTLVRFVSLLELMQEHG